MDYDMVTEEEIKADYRRFIFDRICADHDIGEFT